MAKLHEKPCKPNPFDKKTTNSKFDIVGRKVKGSQGNPAISKQKGIDARKKTLLHEYKTKNVIGQFLDKRIGEKDFKVSMEDKMVQRFAREKQRKVKKSSIFNLQETALTHLGKHLGDNLEDDVRLSESESDNGQIDRNTVRNSHFGNFDEVPQDGKKKSKSEIMKEVMAKSKFFKFQRQQINEENSEICEELNEEFNEIRGLLDFSKDRALFKSTENSNDYDKKVHELIYEKRATPTDRLKTEYEVAKEEREKLLETERKKLKRMRGEPEDSAEVVKKSADSLEDDFVNEKPARLTLEDILNARKTEDDNEESDFENDDSESDQEHSEDDSENESESEECNDSEDSEHEEQLDFENESGENEITLSSDLKAFSLEIPQSHEALLELIEIGSVDSLKLCISRFQKLFHPSLHVDNKGKMSNFVKCLLNHVVFLALQKNESFVATIEGLIPTLNSLVIQYPFAAAEVFKSKLEQELTNTEFIIVCILINHFFSTSDFKHHIVSPCLLLMNQKLENLVLNTHQSVLFGLTIAELFLEMQKDSKRYSPEVINFLYAVISLFFAYDKFLIPEKPASIRLDKSVPAKPLNFKHLLECELVDSAFDGAIFQVLVKILKKSVLLYESCSSFIEIYNPLLNFLQVEQGQLNDLYELLKEKLSISGSSRTWLQLQKHKPIPLQTLAPKFEFGYSLDKKYDREFEDKKLKAQYKKEKKGAIRELRKDNAFIAQEKQNERRQKDLEYKDKLKNIYSTLSNDQSESKKWSKNKKR